MTLLVLLSDVLTGATTPTPLPDWVGTLGNPLVSGLIVAILTQLAKAVPAIPVQKGSKVAALAAILSVLVGALSAYTQGSFAGFDFGAAWNIILASIATLVTAHGLAEVGANAKKIVASGPT